MARSLSSRPLRLYNTQTRREHALHPSHLPRIIRQPQPPATAYPRPTTNDGSRSDNDASLAAREEAGPEPGAGAGGARGVRCLGSARAVLPGPERARERPGGDVGPDLPGERAVLGRRRPGGHTLHRPLLLLPHLRRLHHGTTDPTLIASPSARPPITYTYLSNYR